MRNLAFAQTIAVAGLMTYATHASGVEWDNKTIQQLQPDHPSANCFFFTLTGVPVADSSVAASPWVAIDRDSHPGARDLMATLLAARVSGTPVTVITSGTLSCGYAGVSFVIM
jgi:hypothetical protein